MDDVLFTYKGPAYNRPLGRGLVLGDSDDYLEDMIPEGDVEIEVVVRRVVTPPCV